jgi:dTDP-4-dehydrorhamnose reductase
MSHDDLTALGGQRVLITGADGMLGRAFTEALATWSPSTRVLARSRRQLDVTDATATMGLADERPDIIIHCAGLTDANQCELDRAETRRVHVGGARNIIRLARAISATVLYPQSVFIFDGRELPVTEHTVPSPGLEYGRAKLEAEELLCEELDRPLVVRMAGFFGGDDRDKNFVGQFTRTLDAMLARGEAEVEVGDRVWQPTYTLDLARNCLLLLARERHGIYHMGSPSEAAFHEVAEECVVALGLTSRVRVIPVPSRALDLAEPARRPRRMMTRTDRLDAEGLNRQRPWRDALQEYLRRPWFDRLRHAR